MKKTKSTHATAAKAYAPATSGNLGVGFDILGACLEAIGDTVKVRKIDDPQKVVIIDSGYTELTKDPSKNTASAGVVQWLKDLNLDWGVEVEIKKGIPVGSGLGGSASSAVAGVLAFSALLPKKFIGTKEHFREQLLKYAVIGEAAATGSYHADNVAPCIWGGITLIQKNPGSDTPKVVPIPFPKNLVLAVALPNFKLETKTARAILKKEIALTDHVLQTAQLAGFLAGCYTSDPTLISRSFNDLIIEPQRAPLIPGFLKVKEAALKSGALGCTISGAGPAVIAIASKAKAKAIAKGMALEFEKVGLGPVQTWLSPVSQKGAHIIGGKRS